MFVRVLITHEALSALQSYAGPHLRPDESFHDYVSIRILPETYERLNDLRLAGETTSQLLIRAINVLRRVH